MIKLRFQPFMQPDDRSFLITCCILMKFEKLKEVD